MPDQSKKNGASVILYVADKVLLQRRTDDAKTYPSFWTTFGGHTEDGESPVTTATREIREELGISIDPSELHVLGTIRVLRGDETGDIYYYSALLQAELSELSLGEGSGIGLFGHEAIYGLDLTPEARLAIERHFKHLGFGWVT